MSLSVSLASYLSLSMSLFSHLSLYLFPYLSFSFYGSMDLFFYRSIFCYGHYSLSLSFVSRLFLSLFPNRSLSFSLYLFYYLSAFSLCGNRYQNTSLVVIMIGVIVGVGWPTTFRRRIGSREKTKRKKKVSA